MARNAFQAVALIVFVMMVAESRFSSSDRDRYSPARQSKHDPIDPTGADNPGIVIVYKKTSNDRGDRDRDRGRDRERERQTHHSYEDRDRHFHPHPPPQQSSHRPSSSGFSPIRKPGCADAGGFYCSFDKDDYPMDKIKNVADQYGPRLTNLYEELNHYPLDQYISHDNNTHSYRHKGHFICESEVSYVRPGWAKNWRGEWVTVLNTDVFPQSVRIETCKYANKRCDYVTACYKSYCVQRYTYVKLICVDPYNPDKKPSVDVFEIPSACSCFVENSQLY